RSGEAWRSVAAKRDPDAGIGADPGRLIGEDLLIIFVQQVLNPAEQLHTVGEAVGAGEVHQDEIIQPNPRAWRRINKLVVLHPAIIVGAEIDVASAIEEPVVRIETGEELWPPHFDLAVGLLCSEVGEAARQIEIVGYARFAGDLYSPALALARQIDRRTDEGRGRVDRCDLVLKVCL